MVVSARIITGSVPIRVRIRANMPIAPGDSGRMDAWHLEAGSDASMPIPDPTGLGCQRCWDLPAEAPRSVPDGTLSPLLSLVGPVKRLCSFRDPLIRGS